MDLDLVIRRFRLVVDEIVGERIVIIDDNNHGGFWTFLRVEAKDAMNQQHKL